MLHLALGVIVDRFLDCLKQSLAALSPRAGKQLRRIANETSCLIQSRQGPQMSTPKVGNPPAFAVVIPN